MHLVFQLGPNSSVMTKRNDFFLTLFGPDGQPKEMSVLQISIRCIIVFAIDKCLGKSRRMRKPFMVVAPSRVGKTEKCEYQAAAYPGDCRTIRTPPGNDLFSLLRRVAESLGVEAGPVVTLRVLAETRLRAAFFEPTTGFRRGAKPTTATYSRNTSPTRLNWFRDAIMDRDIPAVLVCTPQRCLKLESKSEQ